ncbi:HEAT repeat domain-containing protein [Tautonia sp. JC769]|uniref:HEAT repeat domain-containing protein n=1 Tax=Tautonia sp. JC769 TaxID=3232135 RepID=UPI00345AF51C
MAYLSVLVASLCCVFVDAPETRRTPSESSRPGFSEPERLQQEIQEQIAERERLQARPLDEWVAMLEAADAAGRRRLLGTFSGAINHHIRRLRPIFLRSMEDPDFGVRLVAANVVAMNSEHWHQPPDEAAQDAELSRAVAIFEEALEQPDPEVWGKALYGLRHVGEKPQAVLPQLVRFVRLEAIFDSGHWYQISRIVAGLGEAAAPAVDDLTDVLKSDRPRTRALAARLLGFIGGPARPAIPALLEHLRSPDPDTAITAHIALRGIDEGALPRPSPARRFVPELVAAVAGDDFEAGRSAVIRLAHIGPDAIDSLPAILGFFHRYDDAREVDERTGLAVMALASMVSEPMFGADLLPRLFEQVRSAPPEIACTACTFIGNNALVSDVETMAPLIRLLDETSGQVKGCVAQTLGSIGRSDPGVGPLLNQALKDPSPHVRRGALQGLFLSENPSPEVIDAVEAATEDADPEVREYAQRVLDFLKIKRKNRDMDSQDRPRQRGPR